MSVIAPLFWQNVHLLSARSISHSASQSFFHAAATSPELNYIESINIETHKPDSVGSNFNFCYHSGCCEWTADWKNLL